MYLAGQRDRKYFKTGVLMGTGYYVQTPNLHLTFTFLNKIVHFFMIFNQQVLIESRNRKP